MSLHSYLHNNHLHCCSHCHHHRRNSCCNLLCHKFDHIQSTLDGHCTSLVHKVQHCYRSLHCYNHCHLCTCRCDLPHHTLVLGKYNCYPINILKIYLFYSSPQTIRGPYLLCIVHQNSRHMCHWCGEEECCRFHHKCHSQYPEYSHSAHHRYTGSCGSSGRQGSHCCTPHHCSTQVWDPCPHILHSCS